MPIIKKCKCPIISLISYISFKVFENDILPIIKSLDPNEADGWNNMPVKMI